ncbi:MAG: hypothetical protein K0V04_11340 [Deltaproteobacteria bacterium]|nr:hypothetical protein [Deltaproteobacteria bacterium]
MHIQSLSNPRLRARQRIQASVPPSRWSHNGQQVARLRQQLRQHRLTRHPAITRLASEPWSHDRCVRTHLEFRHVAVQPFTDALVMAQYLTRNLEPTLPPGAKMYARALLTLNTLDEFGFWPGVCEQGYYLGDPIRAHYPLFESVLESLGVDRLQRDRYAPSGAACAAREALESSYRTLPLVLAFLGVLEEVVQLYSPSLRALARGQGVQTHDGYYHVHGRNDDPDSMAFDTDHQDDLWCCLQQSLGLVAYEDVSTIVGHYCDCLAAFWDEQIR